jgi:hypothetical protein
MQTELKVSLISDQKQVNDYKIFILTTLFKQRDKRKEGNKYVTGIKLQPKHHSHAE